MSLLHLRDECELPTRNSEEPKLFQLLSNL